LFGCHARGTYHNFFPSVFWNNVCGTVYGCIF
jgi:hypothetical protein